MFNENNWSFSNNYHKNLINKMCKGGFLQAKCFVDKCFYFDPYNHFLKFDRINLSVIDRGD